MANVNYLTHLCRMNSSTSIFGQVNFLYKDVWLVFIVNIFVDISELIANSVGPDQTPRANYLLMSLLWVARHKWVKECLFDLL